MGNSILGDVQVLVFHFLRLTQCIFIWSLPSDPRQWTETHVRDWVMWAVNEFSLKGVDFQKFCMSGAALCGLGKDCFLELAPDFVGDILWEHLEILQKGKSVKTVGWGSWVELL